MTDKKEEKKNIKLKNLTYESPEKSTKTVSKSKKSILLEDDEAKVHSPVVSGENYTTLLPSPSGFKVQENKKADEVEEIRQLLSESKISPASKKSLEKASKNDFSSPKNADKFKEGKEQKDRDFKSEFEHNHTAALSLIPVFYPKIGDVSEIENKLNKLKKIKTPDKNEKEEIKNLTLLLTNTKTIKKEDHSSKKYHKSFKAIEKILTEKAIKDIESSLEALNEYKEQTKKPINANFQVDDVLTKLEKNIIEHANRRVDLFFYTLVVYYQTKLYPIQDATVYQHGTSKKFGNKTAACHSSFFPSLRDQAETYQDVSPGFEIKRPKSTKKVIVGSILYGLHFLDSLNATMALPKFVNHLDGLFEGKIDKPSQCRGYALQIIQKVSRGDYDPIEGLKKFLSKMHDIFKDEDFKEKYLNDSNSTSPKRIREKIFSFEMQGTLSDTWLENKNKPNEKYIQMLLRFTEEEISAMEDMTEDERSKEYRNKMHEIRKEIVNTSSTFTRDKDGGIYNWSQAEINAQHAAPHLMQEIEEAIGKSMLIKNTKSTKYKIELEQLKEKYKDFSEQKSGLDFANTGSKLLRRIQIENIKALENALPAKINSKDEKEISKELKKLKEKNFKNGKLIKPNAYFQELLIFPNKPAEADEECSEEEQDVKEGFKKK